MFTLKTRDNCIGKDSNGRKWLWSIQICLLNWGTMGEESPILVGGCRWFQHSCHLKGKMSQLILKTAMSGHCFRTYAGVAPNSIFWHCKNFMKFLQLQNENHKSRHWSNASVDIWGNWATVKWRIYSVVLRWLLMTFFALGLVETKGHFLHS